MGVALNVKTCASIVPRTYEPALRERVAETKAKGFYSGTFF